MSFASIRRAPAAVLIAWVRAYRFALSPWLGTCCRFEPSCSAYAIEALQRHGALAGTALTGWRLLRCHPWCEGGRDDVPPATHGLFTRLVPGSSSPAEHPRP